MEMIPNNKGIDNAPIQVAIGYSHGSIGITKSGKLTIGPDNPDSLTPRYDLGPATKNNFKSLINYLERLSINATDK